MRPRLHYRVFSSAIRADEFLIHDEWKEANEKCLLLQRWRRGEGGRVDEECLLLSRRAPSLPGGEWAVAPVRDECGDVDVGGKHL